MAFHLREHSFDATLEAASEHEDAVVVHGWVNQGGFWHVHAWVQTGAGVVDLTETRDPQDPAAYCARLGIDPARTVRYGRVEFFTLFAEHGHMGPFDPAFEAARPEGE